MSKTTYIREGETFKKLTTETQEVPIGELATRYQALKARVDALPKPKSEPDQETLAFYNERLIGDHIIELRAILHDALALYYDADGIRDAGLLPEAYTDGLIKLEGLITTLQHIMD